MFLRSCWFDFLKENLDRKPRSCRGEKIWKNNLFEYWLKNSKVELSRICYSYSFITSCRCFFSTNTVLNSSGNVSVDVFLCVRRSFHLKIIVSDPCNENFIIRVCHWKVFSFGIYPTFQLIVLQSIDWIFCLKP